jgi:peptidoglycan hydrolase-like protein with peptidoglycan-binding domain
MYAKYEHDGKHITPSVPNHDDALAPGRGSRSSGMNAPTHPVVGGLLQRKARNTDGTADHSDGVTTFTPMNGQPMPAQLRSHMEHALSADFSAVRIHQGPQAQALGALAYTKGTDIHFAPGQYQPDTRAGKELLGHELTHVVQQAQGRVAATTQAKGIAINNDPSLEREADEMGARVAQADLSTARPLNATGQSLTNRPGDESVQRTCKACEEATGPEAALHQRSAGATSHATVTGTRPAGPGVESSVTAGTCSRCGAEGALVQDKDERGTGETTAVRSDPSQLKADIQASSASGSVVQRLTSDEKQENLKSPTFAGMPRLEAAFDNSPAMRRGEVGLSVSLIQDALVKAGFPLPGSTNASGELDEIFGAETERAVRAFQNKFALRSRDGVVGRETLGMLDELAGAIAPLPPLPHQPPDTTPAQQVATANAARIAALNFAIMTLLGLEQALVAGLDARAIRASFPSPVSATEVWLKAKPEDPDYLATVRQAKNLLIQNLNAGSQIALPPASDVACKAAKIGAFACKSSTGVNACQPFFTTNLDCQRDILVHEFNHVIGMKTERGNRGSVQRPADAFNNADSMAEFVTQLSGSPTDRCSDP